MNRKNILYFLLLPIIIALATHSAKGQQKVVIEHKYGFVCYDQNHLTYDTASPYMRQFFGKWHKVATQGQGNLNIVHIGGSHVQGGFFTNRIRDNFTRSGELVADRGMIFPYSAAAGCNNPGDYFVHCPEKVSLTRCVHRDPQKPMGLCGISITAHDTLTHMQIGLRAKHPDFATKHIVIFGETTDDIVPYLNISGRDVVPSYVDKPSRRFIYNLKESTDSIEIIIPCHHGESFCLQGIYFGNNKSGYSYHAIGVNGASLSDFLKCQHFTDDLRLLHPDLVVFGIGINDASGPNFDTAVFYRRYMHLVDSVRSVNPMCAFLFVTNNDSYRRVGRRKKAPNKNGRLAQETFYRLAENTGGAVWDQYKIMGGYKSVDNWRKAKLAKGDRVHFTIAGYTLLGDMMYNALIEARDNAWEKNQYTMKPSECYKPAARANTTPVPDKPYEEKPVKADTTSTQKAGSLSTPKASNATAKKSSNDEPRNYISF